MIEKQEKKATSIETIMNLIWRFAERCGAQGVNFCVSIILARILVPEDYGTIALVTIFIGILNVFVDSGLGNALVQKKDADDLDFSTVFYSNIVLCIVLYAIAYMIAPVIASFYNNELLIPVIRVLSLSILISGVKNVQQAYVSKNMIFKKFFFATLGGTIVAAIAGIYMAYNGYGVWALVVQQVLNALIDTIVLWVTVKWRPKKMFSFSRFKQLFAYGSKLLVSNLINTVYNDLRQLIIGKVYSTADLAYYNRGKQFPHLIVTNINSSIDSVLLPVMSSEQDNKQRVKIMTRRAIKTSGYLMWPLMFGLMAVGRNLIAILLTDKWLGCVPYLYIFCFVNGMMPIHTTNLNAIKAMGRSDLFLKMEIIKKCVGITLMLIAMNISVFVLGLSSVFYTLFASVVNAFPNKKLLGYSYKEQIRDMLPAFAMSVFMWLVIFLLPIKSINVYAQVLIKIIVGGAIYLGGTSLFKFESYIFIKNVLVQWKKTLNKGRKL